MKEMSTKFIISTQISHILQVLEMNSKRICDWAMSVSMCCALWKNRDFLGSCEEDYQDKIDDMISNTHK